MAKKNVAEVNRLEKPIRDAISGWLNINQYPYDFSRFCVLKRQLMEVIGLDTPEHQLEEITESVITRWRKNDDTVTFYDWCELTEELLDQIIAKQQQVKRDEGLRHAS